MPGSIVQVYRDCCTVNLYRNSTGLSKVCVRQRLTKTLKLAHEKKDKPINANPKDDFQTKIIGMKYQGETNSLMTAH